MSGITYVGTFSNVVNFSGTNSGDTFDFAPDLLANGTLNGAGGQNAQPGDLVLIAIESRNGAAPSGPTGANGSVQPVLKAAYATDPFGHYLYWKILTTADLTYVSNGGNHWQWVLPAQTFGWAVSFTVYRNVATATPLGPAGTYDFKGTGGPQNGGLLRFAGVTSPAAGSLLYVAWATDYAGGVVPPSMTLRSQRSNGGSFYVSDEFVGPGPTGPRTMNTGNAYGGQSAIGVIINSNNTAPLAPTITSPIPAQVWDGSVTQQVTWTFNDLDTGDFQTRYDVQYRILGSANWATFSSNTATPSIGVAPFALPNGDYEVQVRTYDSLGTVGPWSPSTNFSVTTPPPPPSITAPANGAAIPTSSGTVTWTASSQDAYQVRRVADSAGSADTSTIYFDSGIVATSFTRSLLIGFPVNSRYEHVQVRVRVNTLWSSWADVRIQVAWSPPNAPTVAASTDDSTASILVTPTVVAAVAPVPATSYLDVYLRNSPTGTPLRVATGVAPGSTWRFWTPRSGIDYQFLIRAVSSTGTTADSAWTVGSTPVIPSPGGGPGPQATSTTLVTSTTLATMG